MKNGSIDAAVERARVLALAGDNEAAKQAYLEALRLDPAHFAVLSEFAAWAHAGGHRSAARTAYRQAVRHHPANPIGRARLAHVLAEDGDHRAAQAQYETALALDPECFQAHRGLARILADAGDPRAEHHRQKGFVGYAIDRWPYRGVAPGVPLLLLATTRLGNMPTRQWIDDRIFAVTVVYVEFWDAAQPLPPHALIVNAIGDADLCAPELAGAEALLAGSTAPVINPPARVRATGRAANAHRFAATEGVVTPEIATLARSDILAADRFRFPLLLRASGFHTGRHFLLVESREGLAGAADALPDGQLMAIQYLDARGVDGMARKYRVMCIGGEFFPVHLAISADWKVHYFSAAMATNAAYRAEEQRFLEDMPAVLGDRAMAALAKIFRALGLDYAGIDFALAPDGSILLFEANATMTVFPPPPGPIWDYRRRAAADFLKAARRMAFSRAGIGDANARVSAA